MAKKHIEKFKERADNWKPAKMGPQTPEGVMNSMANLPDGPKTWELSEKGRIALSRAITTLRTKHGLSAAVPIICKAEHCPYAATCPLVQADEAPHGEPCPLEIGTIMVLFEDYCRDLGVDVNSIVNLSLIKDLIDCHIMISRADALIATSGDIIEEVAVGVTEDGEVVNRPELSKALEVKERYTNLKTKILNQLNATPKDKANDKTAMARDPSSYAAELIARKRKLQEKNIIDADKVDVVEGDIIEE